MTNLSGWRRPADMSAAHGGEFSDTAWARCRVDEPYPQGGWHVPVEERDLPWYIVQVEIAPSIVQQDDGSFVMLTWNGSASDPRIVGIEISDGSELVHGSRLGPAPIVSVAVTTHTGVTS